MYDYILCFLLAKCVFLVQTLHCYLVVTVTIIHSRENITQLQKNMLLCWLYRETEKQNCQAAKGCKTSEREIAHTWLNLLSGLFFYHWLGVITEELLKQTESLIKVCFDSFCSWVLLLWCAIWQYLYAISVLFDAFCCRATSESPNWETFLLYVSIFHCIEKLRDIQKDTGLGSYEIRIRCRYSFILFF